MLLLLLFPRVLTISLRVSVPILWLLLLLLLSPLLSLRIYIPNLRLRAYIPTLRWMAKASLLSSLGILDILLFLLLS